MSARTVVVPRPAPLPWWKRLFLYELGQGLSVTLVYFFRGIFKTFTVQYPEERLELKPRFRGYPRLRYDENGGHLCNVCKQCERFCPTHCILVEGEPKPEGKGRQPKIFNIDYERCCQCGICQDVCGADPISAIYMSHDFELAGRSRAPFKATIKELYEGIQRDKP